tara:strand:+ start:47842 stop:48036 length:195 start_codon:yes stop_codon:yes gene_type:complete
MGDLPRILALIGACWGLARAVVGREWGAGGFLIADAAAASAVLVWWIYYRKPAARRRASGEGED